MGAAGDVIEVEDADLPAELHWIWRTWMRLNECRQWHGGGMSAPIPATINFSAILEWADYHEYDEDMVFILDHCVRDMDKVYISHIIEQAKK